MLDNFLDNLLRSDPLPLSDCIVARRAIRASRRSPPQPPTTGRFWEVRALFLFGGRRLPSQLLVGLEGSGGGRLDSGGSAGWLSDPLRPSTSSIRAASLPAGVLTSGHQGSRLPYPGTSDPSSEGGSRTSPSVSRLLQPSLPRPQGFGVVAPHHWPLDPERLCHLVSFYMETPQSVLRSIRPGGWTVSLDLQDSYLQIPIHYDSLRGRRKDVPVQGPLLRSHNRAPSLHEDYGSHFRHPPQVWTIDLSWPIHNSPVYIEAQVPVNFFKFSGQINLQKSSLVPLRH